MDLFTLRHSESPGNKENRIDSISKEFDLGLTEEGKKQALELVSLLKKNSYDIIMVSPLNRTMETLKPFLNELENPKVITSDLTIERNFGEMIGKPISSIEEYHIKNNIIDRVSFRPPNGESILEVYERAKKFVKYLKDNFQNKSILLCGHKNFIKCLDIVIKNKDIRNFYSYDTPKNGEIWRYKIK